MNFIRDKRKEAAAVWLFIIATLLGMVFFLQGYLSSVNENKPFLFKHQLEWALFGFYLWALFFPLILWIARKFPCTRATWKTNVPIQIVSAILFSSSHAILLTLITNWLPYMEKPLNHFSEIFSSTWGPLVTWRIVLYFVILAVCQAVENHSKLRESEVYVSQIEVRILRAQMEALKMQIDPDFMFQTLHSISDLMHEDLAAADKMVARLGDFLRLTLENSGNTEVTLRKELEFLKCYLEIQKIRLKSPLVLQSDIHPDALDSRVPNMILIPLIEDAVRSSASSAEGEPFEIRARKLPHACRIEISDPRAEASTGTEHSREVGDRLQKLYGSAHLFQEDLLPHRGKITLLEIPAAEEGSIAEPGPMWEQPVEPELKEPPEPDRLRGNEFFSPDSADQKTPWLGIVISFTVIASYFIFRDFLSMMPGEYINWPEEIFFSIGWYLWVPLTPLIFWAGRKFPLERPFLLRNILWHALLNAVFSFVVICINIYFYYLDSPQKMGLAEFFAKWLRSPAFSVHILTYWTILAISLSGRYYREYRQEEVRSTQLRTQLARAQLQALKMQLHPHFLFNTLNSISELIQEDRATAEKMMSHLEQFLRLTVNNSEAQEVPFETELEFLKCYLEIEHVRFQDRLSVDIDIEPQAMSAQVPNLLLQPIVENAIRHGIAPMSTAGHIEIRATSKDGILQVQVQDNGPGISTAEQNGSRKGLGLSNTKERLHQMYGKHHRFELANAPEGGLVVTLEIPLHNRP